MLPGTPVASTTTTEQQHLITKYSKYFTEAQRNANHRQWQMQNDSNISSGDQSSDQSITSSNCCDMISIDDAPIIQFKLICGVQLF